MHDYAERLQGLARFLGADPEACARCVADLQETGLATRISDRLHGVPEFSEADLSRIESFHLFRTFLYVLVRLRRPGIFLETGVLNGFSSAFILQAMEDNGSGRLISIDLPSVTPAFLDQGTAMLPAGREPGWAVPNDLRHRHDLRLGRSELLLPSYFLSEKAPEIFMHDSDHVYAHMMFEMTLAWRHLAEGAIMVVDNIEQNDAFEDFCRGANCEHLTIVSYPETHPEYWLHGVVRR